MCRVEERGGVRAPSSHLLAFARSTATVWPQFDFSALRLGRFSQENSPVGVRGRARVAPWKKVQPHFNVTERGGGEERGEREDVSLLRALAFRVPPMRLRCWLSLGPQLTELLACASSVWGRGGGGASVRHHILITVRASVASPDQSHKTS